MRDPYTVLGVAKTATPAEIKKAFRRLAKQFHPDQSKDPKAKERFSEANQAYEIVGDETKRAAFDRGEIDAEGKPRGFEGFSPGGARPRSGAAGFEHFEFNMGGAPNARGGRAGFDPSDMFADLFSGGMRGGRARAPVKGEDVAVEVSVPLADAFHGGTTRVLMPSGRTLDVAIPPGIEDARQIRLRGQGQPSPTGGEPGDAIVTVKLGRHPHFRLEGRDLRLDLPVTPYEAALGGKVTAPTMGGAVELTVQPGSNGGRTLRLRGKGWPASGATPAGDLLVTLRIVLPDVLGADLEKQLTTWRDEHPYSPRAGMV